MGGIIRKVYAFEEKFMRYSYDVYKDILKGEYLDVYEGVKAHILGADLSSNKKEMSLCEVLDLFVKCQDEGKTVDEVTGGNIKAFSAKYTMDYYNMNPRDFRKDYRNIL